MFFQFVLLRITINGFFIPDSFQSNSFFSNNLTIPFSSIRNNVIIKLKNSQYFCHFLHLFWVYFCHFLYLLWMYFCHFLYFLCLYYINIAYFPFFTYLFKIILIAWYTAKISHSVALFISILHRFAVRCLTAGFFVLKKTPLISIL